MSRLSDRFDQMFPVLDARQLEAARRFASGAARTFAPGELAYDVGTRNAPAWLVIEGGLEVVRRDGLHRQSSVISLGPGQFSGEVSQLSGHGTIAAGLAGPKGCTALPFDAAHIRALMVGSAELGELMMRAFILRRVALIQEGGDGAVAAQLADLAGKLAGPERNHRGLAVQPVAPYDLQPAFDDQPGRRIAGADVVDLFAGRKCPRRAAGKAPGGLELAGVEHWKHLVEAVG
jgi:CRP-like cAMP-binding protein